MGSEKLESVTRPELPDPPGGTVALFSCSKDQVAYESDALKHGYLFHFVIDGLEGKAANKKDGRITWLGLAKHVDDELADAVVQELGPKAVQTPEVRGEARGLVLARLDASTTEADLKDEYVVPDGRHEAEADSSAGQDGQVPDGVAEGRGRPLRQRGAAARGRTDAAVLHGRATR